MKTESKLTRQILSQLTSRNPQWEVIKHADRFSTGIPDASFTLGPKTFWLELKVLQKLTQILARPKDWVDNQVQLARLLKMNGYYWVHDERLEGSLIIHASQVLAALRSGELLKMQLAPGLGVDELEKLITENLCL
jgi:hypothetical protein